MKAQGMWLLAWRDLDWELFICQPHLNISAAPKGWYATTFFSGPSLQCCTWKVLPFGYNFRMFEIAKKMKEEITRWGRNFRRQPNWLQTGFKAAYSKCFSQLENLFCCLLYCTILVAYLPAASRRVWIITVLSSNGWLLPKRYSLDCEFLAVSWKLDLFWILSNLFLSHHDWDIMNPGWFSSLCTVSGSFPHSLFVKASSWWHWGGKYINRFLPCLFHKLIQVSRPRGAELQSTRSEGQK